MVKNGTPSRFVDWRNNWRYKPSGALTVARNGKTVKPAGGFVRAVILADALKIGRAQNSKTAYQIARGIYSTDRSFASTGPLGEVSVARSTYRALFQWVGIPPRLVWGVKAPSRGTFHGAPRNATDR